MSSTRRALYDLFCKIRGIRVPEYIRQYRETDASEQRASIFTNNLRTLLLHCQDSVPYYRKLFQASGIGVGADHDPFAALQLIPQLTKPILRQQSQELRSDDLGKRVWFTNTSGGSTGEPVRIIQDREYSERSAAVTELYSNWSGSEYGEPRIYLWGSERDLFHGRLPWRTRLGNALRNTKMLNAFSMTPERMRQYLSTINQFKPRLLICYAQAIYELALFAEREGLAVAAPRGIITTAGTLYPFMREKTTAIFGCPVFNRYGSREVSLIAGERTNYDGMVVSNFNNFIEVVDDAGTPVPPGKEGNILVTNLINFAMPLVRYAIGDRGILAPPSDGRQILLKVSGRNVDMFRKADGTLIDGEYFTHLLYFRDWLCKFQVVQLTTEHVVFKLVLCDKAPLTEIEDIRKKTQFVLGSEVQVDFEFPTEIRASDSGKYRYTISEVLPP